MRVLRQFLERSSVEELCDGVLVGSSGSELRTSSGRKTVRKTLTLIERKRNRWKKRTSKYSVPSSYLER